MTRHIKYTTSLESDLNLDYNLIMKKLFILTTLILSQQAFSNYDSAFPEYYEYCTGTQLKYQKEYFDGGTGGAGGHSFIYVHGLCKDYTKDYPQVIPCDEVSEELKNRYPHKGVGVSLDSDYKNVMWIAVPGKKLILDGNIDSPRAVTKEDIKRINQTAFDLKVFENVELSSDGFQSLEKNSKEYSDAATVWSLGTDIAVKWARDLRCVKTPINKAAVKKVATYLNAQNDSIYKNNKNYEWSFIYNNCTHLSLNAAESFGITNFLKVDQPLVKQLGHLAVPANGFMKLADDLVIGKLKKKKLKKSLDQLENNGLIGLQVGSLLEREKVFPSSVIFKTDDIKGISIPRKKLTKMFTTLKGYEKHFNNPVYTDLDENLNYWSNIYFNLLRQDQSKKSTQYLENQILKIERIKSEL